MPGAHLAVGHLGWLRGALGAALGIATAGAVTIFLLGLLPGTSTDALPWLVAPLGASAVLVFSVPASPLAQPWPVIGGNLISALLGIAMGKLIGLPWLSASFAVGVAISLMSLMRCLHPPGGACALLCSLGAAGPDAWSWVYLAPIGINIFTLVVVGWIYNNLTGHSWPHRVLNAPVTKTLAPLPSYSREDLDAVVAQWDEMLDVDLDDLDALFRALEQRVMGRREAGKGS
ncbi:MAG: HPP family protein [Sphingomonadales bacterium]|nr:MAG: HPP family protein [Sphingomonadales bacterium]TNF05026.1 MAG: HPP family protein [Sphingomonadales bacterium]